MKTRKRYQYIFWVLLFIGISTQAQVNLAGNTSYRIVLDLEQNRGFSACDGEGGILSVTLKGNYDLEIFSGRHNDTSNNLFIDETFTKTSNTGIPTNFTSIEIRAESTTKAVIGCKNTDGYTSPISIPNSFCYRSSGKLPFQFANQFNYELSIVPEIVINEPNNSDYLTNDEFLTINLPDNLRPNEYNWEYAIREGSTTTAFRSFPAITNGRPTNNTAQLRIRGDEFLNDTDFGKVILIRANPRCAFGGISNTITLEYLKSVPRIIRTEPNNVSCYDSSDGSVRLFFDGPLDPNSQGINITISDLSNQIGTTAENDPIYDIISVINTITLDANNSILVPNLPPSVPGFGTRIELFGEGYYTDAIAHRTDETIGRPTYVQFSIANTTPVSCFGGQDGSITLSASGGTNSGYSYTYKTQGSTVADTWRAFSATTTHTLSGLSTNTYEIKVRDAKGCEAKIAVPDPSTGIVSLGAVITRTTEVSQPNAPLTVSTEILNQPTAFGFEDGRIQATIIGGTLISGNRYTYEWRDQNNTLINTTSAIYNAGQGYLATLHSVGTGQYQITVRDANYATAVNRRNTTVNIAGCIASSTVVPLIAPPPLQVRIEETRSISCNNGNAYSDEIDTNIDDIPDQFQDGELTAFAQGGVPFDTTTPSPSPYPVDDSGNLLPYYFNWERQLSDGSWVAVPQKGATITFLSTATYALNITDRNGIVLGTYRPIIRPDGSRAYELESAVNETRFLSQPPELTLGFDSKSPNCAGGNDATATVVVTGGTPPYTYRWSNGETTAAIRDLIGGKYVVFITDSKGCQLEGQLTIDQPGGIEFTPITVKHPTCVDDNDGSLAIVVSGGTPPYQYEWVTGSTATTPTITGLIEGTYRLKITDANECTAFYEETLVDPDPVPVDLGEDRALCLDQSVQLDSTIDDSLAQYRWTSDTGFSSTDAVVNLSVAGTYTATVTTGIGCVGTDTIIITVSDTPIDADFLLTTQAYTGEEVILVNVSNPIGERVVWTVPNEVTIVTEQNEELIVVFPSEGSYEIKMRSYQGDCYEDDVKTIIVEPAIEGPEVFASQGKFIEEFIPYPNPTQGDFKIKVTLAEEANTTMKIMNLTQGVIDERTEKQVQDYIMEYSENLPSGVYILLLETPKGSETRKLVVE